MPWKETSPMNERVKFVAAGGGRELLELCERFGISRKQRYKWRKRYESGGLEGMKDRSRAPHSHPHAVAELRARRASYAPPHPPGSGFRSC